MVDVGLRDQKQHQPSFLDEDFEVIEGQTSISPYVMSLPADLPVNVEQQSGRQSLESHVTSASLKCDQMKKSLSANNDIIRKLVDTLRAQQQNLLRTDRLHRHQNVEHQLAYLLKKQEEWQQTQADYKNLKSQYSLLLDSKDRLELENQDLLCKLKTSTEILGCSSLQMIQGQPPVENLPVLEKVGILEQELQVYKDNLQLTKAANEDLEQRLCRIKYQEDDLAVQIAKLSEKNAVLEANLLTKEADLCRAEQTHRDEIADLRRNRSVEELLDLRRDLADCFKRNECLERQCLDNDSTVNDIIRVYDTEKKSLQTELDRLKQDKLASLTSLTELSRQLETANHREMSLSDEVEKLKSQLRQIDDSRRQETRRAQDDLAALTQQHKFELDSERKHLKRVENQRLSLEEELATARREAEALNKTVEQLRVQCQENADAVNQILSTSETESRVARDNLAREAALRSEVETRLRETSVELTRAQEAVTRVHIYSQSLQDERSQRERQLDDARASLRTESERVSALSNRLQLESAKTTTLESELNSLRVEHVRVRSNFDSLGTQMMMSVSNEQELKERARVAEDTVESLKTAMDTYAKDFDRERADKEDLRRQVDSLKAQLLRIRSAAECPDED